MLLWFACVINLLPKGIPYFPWGLPPLVESQKFHYSPPKKSFLPSLGFSETNCHPHDRRNCVLVDLTFGRKDLDVLLCPPATYFQCILHS